MASEAVVAAENKEESEPLLITCRRFFGMRLTLRITKIMSFPAEQMPSLEDTHQLLVTANTLRGNLQRELVQLEVGRRFAPELKQVFDSVYLPIASSLAARLNAFEITDSKILYEPLAADAELAAAQLRILLKFLYSAVIDISNNWSPAI
jgi:hypothetical protein